MSPSEDLESHAVTLRNDLRNKAAAVKSDTEKLNTMP